MRTNMNVHCWVHLTQYGREIYEKAFTALNVPVAPLNLSELGYARFQLWQLFEFFGGPDQGQSAPSCFEENEIWFSEPESFIGAKRVV